MRKLFVIGLDCAAPGLVFDRYRTDLPTLAHLMDVASIGRMRSCDPPITIPAWMVMSTSKSPGRLGLYGFRHRKGPSYTEGWIANSKSIREPAIWHVIGEAGGQVVLVGVPPGYPPLPVPGHQISCFITPGRDRPYTHPASLRDEIEGLVGEYLFDIEFRVDDRDKLLSELYLMTERRLQVIRHLLTTKPWEYFHWVEIGVDRLHHAFWKFADPAHPKYLPGNRYESVIRDYYRYLDNAIGDLLTLLDDDTLVLVVSDHGAKAMKGAFCVNEWLIREGYLTLRSRPAAVVPLEKADIDWSRTRAWGWGGYYARIFFNVWGRESEGIVAPDEVDALRDELSDRLTAILDSDGRPMATRVLRPETLYRELRGDPPDLMVYFDDLSWRSAGTIGYDTLYLSENDTGPDDAVHDYDGIFILYDPRSPVRRELGTVDILDVAPTLLSLMGLPVPADMEGTPLTVVTGGPRG